MLNALLIALLTLLDFDKTKPAFVLWNVSYLLSISFNMPVVHTRIIRYDQIATRVIRMSICMSACFLFLSYLLSINHDHIQEYMAIDPHDMKVDAVISGAIFLTILFTRLCCRWGIRVLRIAGLNSRTVIFVGAGVNLNAIYRRMISDQGTGYKVKGYFEEKDSTHLGDKLTRLGLVKDAIKYMEENQVDMLFCNLPSSRSEEIKEIINYCENHLVHFYSVPNVRNYVHHRMQVEFLDDVPVLSTRFEPLRRPMARFAKRTFDLIVSSLFLVTVFWWIYLIVAIITKTTMPGPVFFKQKRNGLNGEEFTCLKFRSMKVNSDADKVQATANDPRKTKWGNIMRKTNLDELPQFINVFLGSMSLVGPRPHMVLHTEEYSALIDKYMVRHYAKPGITGWAQVTGSRGETSELWMMEERIKKDIWYVENWTFMLDIMIMVKTVTNMLGGEKGNAY